MRKLKLQMHITLDGFVANTNSEPVNLNWDDELRKYTISNLDNVDYILLGHRTAPDLIKYWGGVAEKPGGPDYAVARLITDLPKLVFSTKTTHSKLPNTTMVNGNLADEINRLKQEKGGDIMVYGGVSFAASLINENLVDEYHLHVEPAAFGSGMPIFKQRTDLKLIKVSTFSNDVVILLYKPSQKAAS